ncbi:hypothetical protein CDAR_107201 [Caerostris darwini]|uniref:Uncharacterized protein n=1 Tax=Caerostris darwini TaxID=1538125 RepID=A0AAV4T0J8_9ARAC|nr:hypothetical protein CDAR_107201 [Caerostris darwini]
MAPFSHFLCDIYTPPFSEVPLSCCSLLFLMNRRVIPPGDPVEHDAMFLIINFPCRLVVGNQLDEEVSKEFEIFFKHSKVPSGIEHRHIPTRK